MDVLEISRNTATLGWLKPLRDGGSKINGYIVDYQVAGQPEDKWTSYSVVKDLSIVVVGLKENTKYKFRVAARNAIGCSLPREAEGIFEVKEQLSKYISYTNSMQAFIYTYRHRGKYCIYKFINVALYINIILSN